MKYNHPETVESIVWQMKLADFPRALNRTKINDLLDGFPPYTDAEVEQNNLSTNVAFPENGPCVSHDARRQLDNALLAPDPLFTVNLDYGARWQRQKWSQIITKEAGKIIKGSAAYVDMQKSINSLCISHGVGATVWADKYRWRPKARGIEDVLIPSNTLLDMENLPFFSVYQRYTAFELWKITHGPKVDPGWNIPMVERAIKWVDQQAATLMSAGWPEAWSPEKMSDRIKQDGGMYASDAVPTIDTFNFFYWSDEGKTSGWRKKIVLDAWGSPGAGGIEMTPAMWQSSKISDKYGGGGSQFLYDSGKRCVANTLDQLVHFQVANVSNKAPFHYHSVRSLGFLIYAVCHLQNRLRCKFNDGVFESLMQYFRVNNISDAERAIRVNLTDKTPLPDGLNFVPPTERWKIDEGLLQMAMQVNRDSIADSSAGYSQDYDSNLGQHESATRTMARVNTTAAMVSGLTEQSYTNKKFQFVEFCRRFCIKDSRDPDVKKFRVNVLRQGVPEEALDSSMWDVEPTRVIGGGNKMLQSQMVDRAMSVFTKLDPSAQKRVLRMKLAIDLDDWSLAQDLVPESAVISDSVHDAQLSAGVMLGGSQLALKEGVNHSEYIEAMLVALGSKVQEIAQRGGVCTPEELMGMQNVAGVTIQGQPVPGNGISNHINIMAQDAEQPHQRGEAPDNTVKEMVKGYSDHLKILMNQVKAFAQRMMEAQQQQAQQNGGGQMSPEEQAKIQATVASTQAKIQLGQESHAQKTAQRQLSFEQQLQQDQARHAAELEKIAVETAHEVALNQARADSQPKDSNAE